MSTPDGNSTRQERQARRRTQPNRGDQQEKAILDAAEQLIGEYRFADLTVAKVAAVAGISRPAVYFYFGSMEDLLVALVTRGLTQLMESIESVDIEPDATPEDVLAIGLQTTANGWRTHGALLHTAIEHAHAVPAIYGQWRVLLDKGVDLYVALMGWAADLGGRPHPDDGDARRHAELCMLMVGYAFRQHHIDGGDSATEERLRRDLLILVTRSLELSV